MKFTVKASQEDIQKAGEDQGEFEVPKAGFYHLKIVEANGGYSKDDDGNEDKSKPRIEVIYEVVGEGMQAAPVDKNYGRIWDYITFGDGYAAQRRVQLTKALTGADDAAIAQGVSLDTDEMVERVVIARLKQEKDKRKTEEQNDGKTYYRARIAFVMGVDQADSYSGAEYDADAFGGADEAEVDTVAENPFGEEASAEETGGLLTREELMALEPKDLGDTAKEFDLDTNALLVRNGKTVDVAKTKVAIVEAILAAQGGNTDSDAGGDENPF